MNENEDINDLITTKIEVSEEEKLEFYKSFLADKPYTGTEKLFDGQFTVQYRTLTVKQSADVFEQLRKDQMTNDITNDASYMMALTNYRLGQAVKSINGVDFLPEITAETHKMKAEDGNSYIRAKAAIFNEWPVFKLSAFAEGLKTFEDKMVHMTKEIQTPNF